MQIDTYTYMGDAGSKVNNILPLSQIISHSDFSKYISFTMYLDIIYI
jgi:hypothetical protein